MLDSVEDIGRHISRGLAPEPTSERLRELAYLHQEGPPADWPDRSAGRKPVLVVLGSG